MWFRRATFVVLVFCPVGCGSTAVDASVPVVAPVPARCSPPEKSPSGASEAPEIAEKKAPPEALPEEGAAVKVDHFDCFSSLDEKRQQSLRRWEAGGPNGAAWNVYGASLICEIALRVPCVGTTEVQIRGNAKVLHQGPWKLAEGRNTKLVEISAKAWEGATEPSDGPFETLVLSLSGVLTCEDPALGTGDPYVDALIAGFAGGE